jgi:hypothetical protein
MPLDESIAKDRKAESPKARNRGRKAIPTQIEQAPQKFRHFAFSAFRGEDARLAI